MLTELRLSGLVAVLLLSFCTSFSYVVASKMQPCF
jgi:hypothetical protein